MCPTLLEAMAGEAEFEASLDSIARPVLRKEEQMDRVGGPASVMI